MSDVVDVLNQLLRAAVADPALAERLPFEPDEIALTPDGARVAGRLAHEQASGRVTLDVGVVEQGAGRYALALTVGEVPAQLGELLEPFRGTLERLEADLRVDFGAGQ